MGRHSGVYAGCHEGVVMRKKWGEEVDPPDFSPFGGCRVNFTGVDIKTPYTFELYCLVARRHGVMPLNDDFPKYIVRKMDPMVCFFVSGTVIYAANERSILLLFHLKTCGAACARGLWATTVRVYGGSVNGAQLMALFRR